MLRSMHPIRHHILCRVSLTANEAAIRICYAWHRDATDLVCVCGHKGPDQCNDVASHIYTSQTKMCYAFDYVVNCLEQKDACNTNTTSIYTTPASMANSLSKDHILYYLSEVWERSAAERLSDAFSLVLY